MSSPMTIRVVLGKFETTLHLYETTAPETYDGFGTFTLHKPYDGVRLVAIQERYVTWQRGRYASGMHTPRPCDPNDENLTFAGLHESTIVDQLLERLSRMEGGA